jgi:MOSC domain-containing protein YiiM
MVTREINSEIPQDRSILRHIVRDLDQNVGVYARIIQPGTVTINDTISFQ